MGKSMKELREDGALRKYLDPRLIKALDHPVREHILAVLNERIASAREIGQELGVDVSSFYHHIEELERLDCIELVDIQPRRGAKERFFRAKRTLFLDDAAWQRLPDSLKSDSLVNSAQHLFDDVAASIEAEAFNARDETHVSWTPGRFDAQGWIEATDLLSDTLDRLTTIRDQAARRLIERGERGIQASMAMLAFESPPIDPAI